MVEIQGTCQGRYEPVRAALAEALEKDDVGASAAVYVDGEAVVDIWGGFADAERTSPWRRDTITCVWSTTKTMTALCALILVDRGDLGLDDPVARHWPEFAAAGKEGVLVRHVLSHTAGLPDFDGPVTVDDLYDRPAVTARLAAQAPRWEPGALGGYHSMTQGFLIGELVRRVTDRELGAFFADEVAGPLGADFHIGLPAGHDGRVAPVIPPPAPTGPEAAGRRRTMLPAETAHTEAWRRAGNPSAGGFGNARSIGLVQSVVACGGTVRGTRLLSAAGCERARELQYRGVDQVLGSSIRYGLGYGLMDGSCFWGGWGGSMVLVDLDNRMTVAYAMNRMLDDGTAGDYRALGVIMAAYDGLQAG